MPIPTMMGYETALSGLEAAQAAIDTTGHNIANANTPGYSRQVVDLTSRTPLSIPAMSAVDGQGADLGTGVDATSITRIRSQFLDVQYRAQNTQSSSASTTATELGDAQTAFQEPGSTGLSSQTQAFYSAWSNLANSPAGPTSAAAKETVVDTATTLAQTFNSVSSQLSTVQSQATQQAAAITAPGGQLTQDANQIAELNGSISQSLAQGQSPNDLEDKRDTLIDDISSLGQVSVTDPGNGLLQISFGDAAKPLVSGTTVNWPQTITAATGGELGALQTLASPTGPVGSYLSSLDTVANQMISAVNSIHSATPFFSGTGAANIAVAATPATVETSSTGAAGGNDVPLAIAALAGGTSDQSYAALVAQVGSDVQGAQATQTNQSAVLGAVSAQRQSISGVSLDEEMTNLISYQQAYQASARTMTTMDSMISTLINNTGAGV